MKGLRELEEELGHRFTDVSLVHTALTHRSYCVQKNSGTPHNERLEFLGDALLGLVIAENLMATFPTDNEGSLSKKRASVVNKDVLSEKARRLNLHEFLILGPGEKEQESHLKPRLLASAYEALLGALYFDAGFEKTKKLINSAFLAEFQEMSSVPDFERDYKTRLQELTQKVKLGTPSYHLISTAGPSHRPEFLVALHVESEERVRAAGPSKKMAEQRAAQLLLAELEVNVTKNKPSSPVGKN
jgi:ribonuclease III